MPARIRPLVKRGNASRSFIRDSVQPQGASLMCPKVTRASPGAGFVQTDRISYGDVHGNQHAPRGGGVKPKPMGTRCPEGGDRTFARTRILMANLLPESVAIQPGEIIAILRVTPDGEGREAAPHIHTSAETATSDGARERPEWSRVASLVHRMSDPIVDHVNESREKEFGSKEEAAAELRDQHMSTRRMRKAANEEIWAAARRYEKLMTTTGVFSPATADGNFEKQLKLSRLVWEYADVFEDDPRVVMANSNVAHHIPTGDAKPIKCHPYNRSPHEKEIISRHVKVMLEEGAIKRVKSPWAAQVVLTPKPDGSWRFCVDYSKLGKVTVRDSYPMPKIESILNSTVGANWFSAHDLKSGYWQCPMATNDGSDLKTAFCTADGQFAWRVMPFGLRNSGATMMRMVDEALQGLLWESAAAYIDDCLV